MKNWRVLAMSCLVLCGCDQSKGPPQIQTMPITGTVTLDDKPLPGAEVVFLPPDSAAVFAGTTKDDGTFQLQCLAGQANCKGLCKVTISRMLKPDGTPVPTGEPPANSGAVESLPVRYSQLAMTELSANVPEAGGKFDFTLATR